MVCARAVVIRCYERMGSLLCGSKKMIDCCRSIIHIASAFHPVELWQLQNSDEPVNFRENVDAVRSDLLDARRADLDETHGRNDQKHRELPPPSRIGSRAYTEMGKVCGKARNKWNSLSWSTYLRLRNLRVHWEGDHRTSDSRRHRNGSADILSVTARSHHSHVCYPTQTPP